VEQHGGTGRRLERRERRQPFAETGSAGRERRAAEAVMFVPTSIVERIWAYDASLWTGADEDQWLGWLDVVERMRPHVGELTAFADAAREQFDHTVLLGMGGSSLAPEVLRRAFDGESFHVLDTTHPAAIRRLGEELELERTLFLASSKSGSTLETRSHLEHFWESTGGRGAQFAAITDPGSELDALAVERGFRAVFAGEPQIGGRYSALSMFGLVPAALLGVDLERFLGRAQETVAACSVDDGNPGYELGLRLGEGWQADRDKICIDASPSGFGLWAEQLLAESTGKDGKGLVPAPGESPEGADRQRGEVLLEDPYDLGSEFFRWEYATAVAGHVLGINPFDQPDVQAAKDKTSEVLAAGGDTDVDPRGSLDELLAQARPGDYVAIQGFVDPAREAELAPLAERARATGCVVTTGLGPRFLHSTGQLHKGGPNTGLFVQVVDEVGDELPIPGRDFGFGALIQAQAAGDLAALEERGRRVIRLRLEELA
jgi:transaldolase / glucose-6-phosphate isomerase